MNRSVAILVALLGFLYFGVPSAAAQSDAVTMSATVNGQDVKATTANQPLRLQPGEWADIDLVLKNGGTQPVHVRRVQIAGRVLGLTFFSYATSVDFTVAPGATGSLRYKLDLTGLEGQATGLIGGDISLTDADGNAIAAVPVVTDIRGSLLSVYGLFGAALVVLTALALLEVALALARHRLPANRWRRGVRFLVPGIGIGLVIAFSASVARLWVADVGLWLVAAGLTAAVFFALGYFSPTPDADEDEDDLEDDEDDDETEVVVASDADTRSVSTDETTTR